METKKISPVTNAIHERFFQAIEELAKTGKIGDERGGLQSFCVKYGYYKNKYSNIRSKINNPEFVSRYKVIDIDVLYYLVRDYGVSAEWLLTGKGNMFKNKRATVILI